MLENLTQRMARVVKTIRGQARLTEANTQEMMREVRLALLEADVALPVVRQFVEQVKQKSSVYWRCGCGCVDWYVDKGVYRITKIGRCNGTANRNN